MRLIKQWLTNTFGFTKSESNGVIVLTAIVFLVAIVPRLFTVQINKDHLLSADSISLSKWVNDVNKAMVKDQLNILKPKKTNVKRVEFVPFNPNFSSLDELTSLGFSPRTAQNILSYIKAGGSFQVKADLKKIYGISENQIRDVWDYIELPEKLEPVAKDKKKIIEVNDKKEEVSEITINLNTADTSLLQKLNGIGPVLSDRIIKYRNLLGGFHSTYQLNEVYGLDEETIKNIGKRVMTSGTLKKININTDSIKHLTIHPYIDYKLGQAIFNYRQVHGDYVDKNEILQIKMITDAQFEKISPYITVKPFTSNE